MIDGYGSHTTINMSHRRQWHMDVARADNVDASEVGWIALVLAINFQNDPVLVARTVDG